jgi:hypothetical protein
MSQQLNSRMAHSSEQRLIAALAKSKLALVELQHGNIVPRAKPAKRSAVLAIASALQNGKRHKCVDHGGLEKVAARL